MRTRDLERRRKELEQSARFHSDQYQHHLSEAKQHKRELEGIRNRLDEIDRYLSPLAASKMASGKSSKTSGHKDFQRSSAFSRAFRAEGPTVVVVRQLYDNRVGLTMFEIQARNGTSISPRTLRKVVKRLVDTKCAEWIGKKVVFTELGIKLWEASPLFLHFKRDGKGSIIMLGNPINVTECGNVVM